MIIQSNSKLKLEAVVADRETKLPILILIRSVT